MARDQMLADPSYPVGIPLTMRIGVTGHRSLTGVERLGNSVDAVLDQLQARLATATHCFVAVSPLAEGADRLVAWKVLARPVPVLDLAPELEAVLPLPVAEYREDFESTDSKAEFDVLLRRARQLRLAPATATRPFGYLWAGKQVVLSCDVLIAIWDGNVTDGSGGTSEIVAFARQIGRWMFWIHAQDGAISEENRPDNVQETITRLRIYNQEHLGQKQQDDALRSQQYKLTEHARLAQLDTGYLIPLWRYLLPQFVRADLLAERFQRRHDLAVFGVTALAVLAVAIVTIQVLFFHHLPQLAWVEVAAMTLILSLLLISRRQEWHRKWIDYRFLAERLRAALFLAACGLDCSPPRPLPHSVAHRPDDWMVRAFAWIWSRRPRPNAQAAAQFEPLRDFVLAAWIRDQAVFYSSRSRQTHRAQERLTTAGFVLFMITLVAAIFHVVTSDPAQGGEISGLSNLLIAVAIILPALGAALADIRIHREYSRNAERYAHMARQMESLGQQIARARDLNELRPLLEEANEVMLREQQDWRVVVLFQELETP